MLLLLIDWSTTMGFQNASFLHVPTVKCMSMLEHFGYLDFLFAPLVERHADSTTSRLLILVANVNFASFFFGKVFKKKIQDDIY